MEKMQTVNNVLHKWRETHMKAGNSRKNFLKEITKVRDVIFKYFSFIFHFFLPFTILFNVLLYKIEFYLKWTFYRIYNLNVINMFFIDRYVYTILMLIPIISISIQFWLNSLL